MQSPRRCPRPSAFTLIELLVVIGILSLLTVMAVICFRVVGGAMKSRVTTTALENCNGLMAEYKLIDPTGANLMDTSLVTQITGPTSGTGLRWLPAPPLNGQPNDIINASAKAPAILPGASGNPDPVFLNREINERYLRDETARVIQKLKSVPKNRASIESFSSDRILKVKYPIDPTVVPTGDPPEYSTLPANQTVEGVVLLDGSGHPIYFIPGGGLLYVNVGYKGTGDKADKTNYESQTSIRAPDHGPFWASPGPDGDLTSGDDNQYSFGQ